MSRFVTPSNDEKCVTDSNHGKFVNLSNDGEFVTHSDTVRDSFVHITFALKMCVAQRKREDVRRRCKETLAFVTH